jgi:hypothetical protein
MASQLANNSWERIRTMTKTEKKSAAAKRAAAAAKRAAAAAAAELAAAAAAAELAAAAAPVVEYHNTDRYKRFGHGKDATTTKSTVTRHTLDDCVALGGCTLAIATSYGDGLNGLRRVVRQCRMNRWSVNGFVATSYAGVTSQSVKTERSNVDVVTLKTLPSDTLIVSLVNVPRLTRR